VSFDTSSLVTSLHGSSVVGAAVGAADAEIAAVGLGVLVAEVELAASELADGVDALHAASSTILNPATTANVGRCIYFSFPSDGDHAPFWVSLPNGTRDSLEGAGHAQEAGAPGTLSAIAAASAARAGQPRAALS